MLPTLALSPKLSSVLSRELTPPNSFRLLASFFLDRTHGKPNRRGSAAGICPCPTKVWAERCCVAVSTREARVKQSLISDRQQNRNACQGFTLAFAPRSTAKSKPEEGNLSFIALIRLS